MKALWLGLVLVVGASAYAMTTFSHDEAPASAGHIDESVRTQMPDHRHG